MKSKFPGYYRPTDAELAKMFKDCVFSFDANVLLNLYRFKPESRDSLVEVLRKLKERIWLTHQAAFEYHDNRVGVIMGQRNMYEKLKSSLDDAIKKLEHERRSPSFHAT